MKVAAVIIDDRELVAQKAINEHIDFLPDDWIVVHQKAPYAGGVYHIKSAQLLVLISMHKLHGQNTIGWALQKQPLNQHRDI